MQETWVQSLSQEDPLEKEMATHSSTLAWKIPWTEEPGRLQSMGSWRVRHDWANSVHFRRRREKEMVWEISWRDYSLKFHQQGKGNSQVQEAQRDPYSLNPRRHMPRHILIKLTKTKHKVRILKAAREKQQVAYKGNPIRLTADLSAEALQDRREWQDILKVFKGKNLQLRLLYPARITFKTDGEIKSFSDKQS